MVATNTPPHSDIYLLGRSDVEQERLRKQVYVLHTEARWLLDQLDIRPGARAIDIGCGPQGILDLLAERVGLRGSVVGLDSSAQFVAAARQFAADRGLDNVEVIQADAKATQLPRASFDLVHTRLVLVNVAEPERVVDEMVALARPGGIVASYEADYILHICHPMISAWTRLFEVFHTYARAHGVDLFVGRKVHGMLRDAGIIDLQVKPILHVLPHGHVRRTVFLDFIGNVREDLVREGFIDTTELHALMEELRRHLDDPHTLVMSHLFYQVWGRKPRD
jgi:SAM-dependent methyltransferase